MYAVCCIRLSLRDGDRGTGATLQTTFDQYHYALLQELQHVQRLQQHSAAFLQAKKICPIGRNNQMVVAFV